MVLQLLHFYQLNSNHTKSKTTSLQVSNAASDEKSVNSTILFSDLASSDLLKNVQDKYCP